MDEFLFKPPGSRRLFTLMELVNKMEDIIRERMKVDVEEMDEHMIREMQSLLNNFEDSTKVEVYDSRILRNNQPTTATLGKMSVTSAIQKFQ